MAVVRKKRRSSLEKALRGGGAAPARESSPPGAASAWGSQLQREVRGEGATPAPTPAPSRPVVTRTAPASAPEPVRERPRPAPRPPSAPLPPVRVAGPSTVQPDVAPTERGAEAPSLDAVVGRLADDHVRRESALPESSAVGRWIGIAATFIVLGLASAIAWVPVLQNAERLEQRDVLVAILERERTRLETEEKVLELLANDDLAAVRDVFMRERARLAAAFEAASLPIRGEDMRVRLVEGGRAIALTAEFGGDEDEAIAVSVVTGQSSRAARDTESPVQRAISARTPEILATYGLAVVLIAMTWLVPYALRRWRPRSAPV